MEEFAEFRKIPRLSREIVVTEKIDGTNGQIFITEDGQVLAGSRSRWLTLNDDNFGFARWVEENKEELLKLGAGRHYGEWWGHGIQRRYGLSEKRFSLFNTNAWSDDSRRPGCCAVVPVLWQGIFDTAQIDEATARLRERGSVASPGFMNPEGVIVYHIAGNLYFKKTIHKDDEFKGKSAA